MSSLIVIGSLFLILNRLDLSLAAGTTIGKLFLFAVPRMMTKYDRSKELPRIKFYMFTAENKTFEIRFHVYCQFEYMSKQFSRHFNITKGVLTVHEVDDELNHKSGTGKQFTFSFDGEDKFGLSVLLYDNYESASMITAIPVTSWGTTYYAFTMNNYPSIHVSTYEKENKILIQLHMTVPSYTFLHKTHQDGDEIMYFLKSYESFQLSMCDNITVGSLSGTFIRGSKPVGVVSGNCIASLLSPSCNGNKDINTTYTSPDAVAEMLLPTNSFGKEFVLFTLQMRKPLSLFEVMAKFDKTNFSTYSSDLSSGPKNYSIALPGHTVQIELDNSTGSCLYLKSKKPVQVLHIQSPACFYDKMKWEDLGDASLSLMIPIELFYFFYVWGIPILGSAENSYVVVVVRLLHVQLVYINEKLFPVDRISWKSITDDIDWTVGEKRDEDHLPFNTIQVGSYYSFGCYVYAVAPKYGYMRPAGAMITTIHEKCVNTIINMTVSDMIDNDCDGKVDEEKEDGKDNDGDLKIDEDIGAVMDSTVKLYREKIKACPPFTYGWNCSKDCSNCVHGCNRENGSCASCRAGYKNAAFGCNEICGIYQYGEDCTGDCSKKCDGNDCIERIHGLCKECPYGFWGKDCLNSCQNCLFDCNMSTGCTRCKHGFKNPMASCNEECGAYEYGIDCAANCRVKCDGKDCSERAEGQCLLCKKYQWGKECENHCSNCDDPCDQITGTCKQCKIGYKEPEKGCITPCELTEYGINCNNSCVEKCKGQKCFEQRFGECTKCPFSTWGLECKERCSNCKDDCDKSFGTCIHCKPGFKSPQTGCNTSCSENEYGEDCAGNCIEKCGRDCTERVFGTCTVDKDAVLSIWGDWHCSKDCSDSFEYRERICIVNNCNKTDGEKRVSECYRKEKCPKDCPPYSWGLDCLKSCDKCKTPCDKFEGTCNVCKPGYKNPSFGCNKECEIYEYGEDCQFDCRKKCKRNDCYERVNGTCNVDGDFSQWSRWTCTKECKSEEEVRLRLCNYTEPAFGGLGCFGNNREVRTGQCLYAPTCKRVSWPVFIIFAVVILIVFAVFMFLFFPRKNESLHSAEGNTSHVSKYLKSGSAVESEI